MNEEAKIKALYLKNLSNNGQFKEHIFDPMVRLSQEKSLEAMQIETPGEKIRFAQGVVYAVQYLSNLFAMNEAMLENNERKLKNERLSKQDRH